MPQPKKPREPLRLEAALGGVLALMVAEREAAAQPGATKTEVLLSGAGLTHEEIASVTGKNPEAIRKAVERARKRTTSEGAS